MIAAIRTCFVTLLAAGVVGCQSRPTYNPGATAADDAGPSGFPIGTYTTCAQGVHNPSGNEFLNAAGFQDGARLTLAQSGTTLTSTYVDQNGLTQTLRFSAETDTSATIHEKGQTIPGFTSLCVVGPGRQTGSPASLTVTAGALSYNAGMVFLNLTGDLRSDARACGTLLQSRASFWVGCQNRQGGSVRSVDARPAPSARMPAGQYSCSTQVEALYHVNGQNQYATGGATGALTLTEDGAKVTAQYSGDPSLSGTLNMAAMTSTRARAEAGQTLMAPCMVTVGDGLPPRTPERVRVAAASLTFIDSTLFISFAGAMAGNSSCPSAQVAGSVICSK
jgi:hypothetical protein